MNVTTGWGRTWRVAVIGSLVLLGLGWGLASRTLPKSRAIDVANGPGPRAREPERATDLPAPSRVPVPQFEEKLFAFLNARRYATLGWARDKAVRDTGPYLGGKSYGTHPAVRVYYSPGVIRWLEGGRVGPIPDGAMIVKEQYPAPAIRHRGKTDAELWAALESWTVMVKDAAGAHDGWFWSNPAKGQCAGDPHRAPFDEPASGFGLYCVRCHAATRSPGAEPAAPANEFTFASLRNIAGYPGEPILYRVDDSWRDDAATTADRHAAHPSCARPEAPRRPARVADLGFLSVFNAIDLAGLAEVPHLPPVTHDRVVPGQSRPGGFVTSNQCMNCHAGLLAPFGPTMFLPVGPGAEYGAAGRDVSPYGEWRWTPMGLAGRDPIFHAQIESEVRLLQAEHRSNPARARELAGALTDTCLRCHGAMGRRQFEIDHRGTDARFTLDHVLAVAGPGEPPGRGNATYGALARDGVSCAVCHRMRPPEQPADDHRPALQYFLESSISGRFPLGPDGEIYGPFRDEEIAPYVMEHATGLKPRHGDFLRSSRMCGSCHTIVLPAVDQPLDPGHEPDELARTETVPLFRNFHHHVEQATYLEWLNSEFENEFRPQNPRARTCQDCHMAPGLKDERLGIDRPTIRTRIAAIQDTTYPEAENLAPHDQLHVRTRDQGFRRHNFSGLNVFLLELFNQFDDVLGVRKVDFMTGSKDGIGHAIADFVRTARDDVAELSVEAEPQAPRRLGVRVVVENKVGHRFPSGVGFRRAFLELAVIQPADDGSPERVVWASGRTDEFGVLLGADGRPLPTESFAPDPQTGRQRYQGHHEVITSPDQVQVYETLLRDAQGRFTTSFVRGCDTVKDNRLLPRGWRREGPGAALTGRFLEATWPGLDTAADPRYADGSGSDEVRYRIELPDGVDPAGLVVRATLYYQAIPPYFLRNLFETAPDGPATRRLHSLCGHLNLEGTPIEDWKLRITSAERIVRSRPDRRERQ